MLRLGTHTSFTSYPPTIALSVLFRVPVCIPTRERGNEEDAGTWGNEGDGERRNEGGFRLDVTHQLLPETVLAIWFL